MVKIFLVEDEIVMREGIKKNIDWESEGFEFVGEASDGELAYPMIQKTKPDILLTDIKMPFMDGLELSRLVRQELPETRIILLSGYDEFQYAKEAIEIGITEYLVKPVTSAQLVEALKKVAKKLLDDRQKREQEKGALDSENERRRRLFRHMVSGRHTFAEVFSEAKEQGVDIAADNYNVLLLQVFSEGGEDAWEEKTRELEEVLGGGALGADGVHMVAAKQGRAEYDFILKGTDALPLAKLTERICRELTDFFEKETQLSYVAALGNPVDRFSELKECYERTNLNFSKRYTTERNRILRGEDLSGADAALAGVWDDGDVKLGEIDVSNLNRGKVEEFLYTGTKEDVPRFVEEYFAQVGDGNVQSILLRQYVMMDLYVTAVSVLEKSGCKSKDLVERCGDAKEMTAYLTTIEQTKEYIRKMFTAVFELRGTSPDKKYDGVMARATAYIRENFQKDGISLNAVAAEVNLSPSHFSTVFGQEMGETFVEYLTKIRMEKAKELLRTTGMRTTDIAFEVGYRDAHYFSSIFKKTQGCTPREYRNRT